MPWGTDAHGTGVYGGDSEFSVAVTQDTGIISEEAFGAGAKVNFTLIQTAGIVSGEAFGAGAVVSRNVVQTTGIPSAETFGVGAKVNFIIKQTTGIVSAEAFGVGAKIGINVVVTAGIPSGEAFGAGAKVNMSVAQSTGIVSGEAFGAGAKVNLTIIQGAGIISGEVFGVGASVNRTVTQLVGIPSSEAFGVGAKVNFIIKQLIGIPSEEAFGAGAEVLVNYVPGWSVKVFRLNGTVVAEVGRHSGLNFLKVLSGKGTGQIVLLLEDALEMDLLDEELVWRVFYDGLWAFSFFSSAVEEKRVSENMDRTVTFSGPGIAECLEWGTVLPPAYPAYIDRNWSWENARAMKIWRDLFAAVQARGTCTMVNPSFSDATDSSGAAWVDTVSMSVEPGGTMYSYLEKFAGIAEADWIMTPSFGLDVFRDYGDHKEDQIRFQIAADQIRFTRGKDRSGVRNVAYAEGNAGGIQEASNGGSITAWGRREAYIQAGDSSDATTTAGIAASLVDQSQDERVQISFQVLPDGEDRKVFYNYDVGTWIGAESDEDGITGDYRCVAIAAKIDTEGNADVELGLQSLFELKQSRLEKLQANGGGNSSVGAGLQSGLNPDGIINAVVTGDPPVAPTGLSLSTGANENRVYIDVSWTGVAPSGADPVVEYEAELSRDGVGTITAQRAVTAPVRFEPVEPGVNYSVRVRAISRFGRSSSFLGPSSITAGTDPSIPAQATGLVMGGAIRSITLTWNENTELDVVNGKGTYDLQIDTVNTFSSGNLRGKRVGGTVMSFTDLPTQVPTTYYGRVRAVDSSGNAGPWSSTASTVTQQAVGTDITPLSIDSALIANAAITNAKIAALAVDNAKISDLSAGKLSAGTITTALITLGSGGVLQAGRGLGPFNYVLLDENGLRFYINGTLPYTGGTLTVDLNVNSGSAFFSGSITGSIITGSLIRTAVSGQRVSLDQTTAAPGGGTVGAAMFYTGGGSETQGFVYPQIGGGDVRMLSIVSPKRSGESASSLSLSDSGAYATSLTTRGLMVQSGSYACDLYANDLVLHANGLCMVGGGSWTWLHTNNASIQLEYWAANQIDVNCIDLRFNSSVIRANGTLEGRVIACNDYDFRLRGSGNTAYRMFYNSGIDGVEVYGNSGVRLASNGAAMLDTGGAGLYLYNIPGGSDVDTILRIAGSNQVLAHTSSIRYKTDVVDLQQEENPVWEMRTVSFKWKNKSPEVIERLNRLRPNGRSVGFIAEEMHSLSPDCVTFNGKDEPSGINESGVLAYAVAGLQYMKSLIDDLRQQVQQLENKKGR